MRGIENATATRRRSCRARFLWQLTQERNIITMMMMMMRMMMRMPMWMTMTMMMKGDPNREPHHTTGGRRD